MQSDQATFGTAIKIKPINYKYPLKSNSNNHNSSHLPERNGLLASLDIVKTMNLSHYKRRLMKLLLMLLLGCSASAPVAA
ncbi:MAG: hypothetical protein O2966_07215 [Proteobacteria bacterium]|nr:hypothetical protein [Pseudomonadota bacterium]